MKRYSLSKYERLCSKNDIELVYSTGKTLLSKSRKLKVIFALVDGEDFTEVRMGVGVSKKAGKAFWRNRVKRLIKESYRLNKRIITDPMCNYSNKRLLLFFSPRSINQKKNKQIDFNYIQPDVLDLLTQIRECVKNA